MLTSQSWATFPRSRVQSPGCSRTPAALHIGSTSPGVARPPQFWQAPTLSGLATDWNDSENSENAVLYCQFILNYANRHQPTWQGLEKSQPRHFCVFRMCCSCTMLMCHQLGKLTSAVVSSTSIGISLWRHRWLSHWAFDLNSQAPSPSRKSEQYD